MGNGPVTSNAQPGRLAGVWTLERNEGNVQSDLRIRFSPGKIEVDKTCRSGSTVVMAHAEGDTFDNEDGSEAALLGPVRAATSIDDYQCGIDFPGGMAFVLTEDNGISMHLGDAVKPTKLQKVADAPPREEPSE